MANDALLVVGSIALDSLQGGRFTDELGGSAIYSSLAACQDCPVRMVAAVGRDGEQRVRRLLAAHPAIEVDLQVLEAPTYRWFADDQGGRNVDLGSRDSIYDLWVPKPPPGWRGWAFVGSMRPDRQLEAATQLAGCGLLAADAMRSYVDADPDTARRLLEVCDWYFCNEEEFAALGGGDPVDFRVRWRLQGLVVKHGPGGVTVYSQQGRLHRPALAGTVVDTTGAGDALAGGMLARWHRLAGDPGALAEAVEHGVRRASLAISDVGTRALAALPAER
ncbi:MAG: PfkB family carbohydrate kinase [Candidatus Dormibacteraeota bacterium]|nr:PfkB family carbohydrate kinase [Candidatus Dormibacteraeota bacterium]